MLSKLICALLFFALNTTAFSQTGSSGNHNLVFSYTYGYTAVFPLDVFSNINTGTVQTIELSNIPEDNIGFFASLSVENFQVDHYNYFYTASEKSIQNYAASIGFRFHSKNKRLFLDLGTGYYEIGTFGNKNIGVFTDNFREREIEKALGFNIGAGGKIILNNSVAMIIKCKLQKVFAGRFDLDEISLNAGLESGNFYQSKTNDNPGEVATGIIAGNFGNIDGKLIGTFGCELTYGLSENLSLVANYINKTTEKRLDASYKQNDYSGGIRNYFGENNLKLFLECLADLNITKQYKDYGFLPGEFDPAVFKETIIMNSIGIVLGSGTEFEISDKVTGIIKGNITFYDNAENTSGLLGGVKYRF